METIDDEAWFCKPGCKHPKCAVDYLKSKHYTKGKLLKSMSISEILPFGDRSGREEKAKNGEKVSKPEQTLNDDRADKNPNLSTSPPGAKSMLTKLAKKSCMEEKTQLDDLRGNSAKSDRKRRLKSTFSARKLVAGGEILSQITEFCTELKKMASKSSTKGASEKASDGVSRKLKEGDGEKERMPLLVVKERKV